MSTRKEEKFSFKRGKKKTSIPILIDFTIFHAQDQIFPWTFLRKETYSLILRFKAKHLFILRSRKGNFRFNTWNFKRRKPTEPPYEHLLSNIYSTSPLQRCLPFNLSIIERGTSRKCWLSGANPTSIGKVEIHCPFFSPGKKYFRFSSGMLTRGKIKARLTSSLALIEVCLSL